MIQGTVPDDKYDKELNMLVKNFQLHKHLDNCWVNNKCKYFYPRPINNLGTRFSTSDKRMIYQCIEEADQMVVPYVKQLLRILESNMDIQICHAMQVILYCCKYITKQSLKVGEKTMKKVKNDPVAQVLRHELRTLQAVFYLSGSTDARKGEEIYHIVWNPLGEDMVLSKSELTALREAEPQSTKITYPSSYELYRRRPLEWEAATMAEYFENIEYPKKGKKYGQHCRDLDNRVVVTLKEKRPVRLIIADPKNGIDSALMHIILFYP